MTMLVGTTDGLYGVDGGAARVLDGSIKAVSKRGSTTWLLHGDRALYQRENDGPWNLTAPIRQRPATCLAATSLAPLIGTAEAHLLILRARIEELEGFDRIVGRDQWYTPWGGPPATRSISEGSDGTLYVNVHVGGIARSADRGNTWDPTIDIDADVHQVLAHPSEAEVVFAASGSGFAMSRDAGDTWKFLNEGLHATYCRGVALTDEFVLVSASRSHRGEQGAVYRKPLAGPGPFHRCAEGLPSWFDGNVDSHCLDGTGSTVAIGSPQGSVFVSQDHGDHWDEVAEGLGSITCLALAESEKA
jgi:hypothetical protein